MIRAAYIREGIVAKRNEPAEHVEKPHEMRAQSGRELALVMGEHAKRRGCHMDPEHLPRSLTFLSDERETARRTRP